MRVCVHENQSNPSEDILKDVWSHRPRDDESKPTQCLQYSSRMLSYIRPHLWTVCCELMHWPVGPRSLLRTTKMLRWICHIRQGCN